MHGVTTKKTVYTFPILVTYLFTFISSRPFSLSNYSIPFISVCKTFFFSFIFSLSSFPVSAPLLSFQLPKYFLPSILYFWSLLSFPLLIFLYLYSPDLSLPCTCFLHKVSLSLDAPNYCLCIQSNSAGFSFVNTGRQVHLKHARWHFERFLVKDVHHRSVASRN